MWSKGARTLKETGFIGTYCMLVVDNIHRTNCAADSGPGEILGRGLASRPGEQMGAECTSLSVDYSVIRALN